MKFSIKNYFSKCDQIRKKLRIWLHLLKKSLMENYIFVQWWYHVKSSTYHFHVKTNISAYFYIHIRLPLRSEIFAAREFREFKR